MKFQREKISKTIICLKKNITDVEIDQNKKAEQILEIEDILRRPLTIVPVFQPDNRRKYDDAIDACDVNQSRTNSSLVKKRPKNYTENDQKQENQMQQKLVNKYDLRASSVTQKSKKGSSNCESLIDGSFDSDKTVNDKLASKEEQQNVLDNGMEDNSDGSSDFMISEKNGGGDFGEISSKEIPAKKEITKTYEKLVSKKKVGLIKF